MTLIERLEQATGPDRELDEAIECALGRYSAFSYYTLGDNDQPDYMPTRFTASIDAAMTLVPEDGADLAVFWRLGNDGDGGNPADFKAEILVASRFTSRKYEGCAATPALALCIAALRAKGVE